MTLQRRDVLKSLLAAGSFLGLARNSKAAKCQRVIVIGAGFAGATAAKYIKMWAADIELILIERQQQFISCPQSNLVLSGSRTIEQLTHHYQRLVSEYGIELINASVMSIDSAQQCLTLNDGAILSYDRLVIAPGVDFIYDDFPMLTESVINTRIPHAWKAGPQTQLLHQQLIAMPQGGQVVMTIPPAPYKCPPGPYERACQIALYLQRHNPTGKLIILDANADIVSKKALFTQVWEQHYSRLIDYRPNNALEDIDVETLTVESEFDSIKADVLNVIPPQKAGKVAELAGVVNVDNRWCAVDFQTYESTAVKNVHVIGDAVASTLPKSGHIANAQAKVCAAAIIALLNGSKLETEPVFGNTCYSFTDAQQAGHVAAVFRYDKKKKAMVVMPGGGVSAHPSMQEGKIAEAWALNIWSDILK